MNRSKAVCATSPEKPSMSLLLAIYYPDPRPCIRAMFRPLPIPVPGEGCLVQCVDVCATSPEKPSMSLLMAIYYPDLRKFRSAATNDGCKHEELSLKEYEAQMRMHRGFSVSPSGLRISKEEGFMEGLPTSYSYLQLQLHYHQLPTPDTPTD